MSFHPLLDLLRDQPVIAFFAVLGLGLVVGKIRVAGIEAGSVTGVLFVGLAAGHVGITVPEDADSIGFLMFIYIVGFQAGPNFLSVFRQNGLRYFFLATLTAGSGAALAILAARILKLDFGSTAGLLAGSLTSTPTLVAAKDAVAQGVPLPPGMTPDQVVANISATYAITYVFGLVGIIAAVVVLPRLLRIDVAAEARKLAVEGEGGGSKGTYSMLRPSRPATVRAYRIEKEEAIGFRLADAPGTHALAVQKIKRDGEVFDPEESTVLQAGDIVSVLGPAEEHPSLREFAGPEVLDYDVLDRSIESRRLVVTRGEIAGQSLQELDFVGRHQSWLTDISRAGQRLARRPDLLVERGDVLVFSGSRAKLDDLAEFLGYEEAGLEETDLVTFAFGIAAGIFVGKLSFAIGAIPIGLGSAGGVMVAGLVMGLLASTRPRFGRLPAGARNVLMELGLLSFMAPVAVTAGGSVVETLLASGPGLAVAGVAVMSGPVLICFVIGRYVMRMNAALLLGAITGALTSTAALRQVNALAKSSTPMLGYVGTYTFANVLLTIVGGVLMRF